MKNTYIRPNFIKGMGIMSFVVVPFGITNSRATFMCLMKNMFHPYLDTFVIVFFDDILVYSKNKEENVEHLVSMFRLLREHQLYANLNKCFFISDSYPLLGICCFQGGDINGSGKY